MVAISTALVLTRSVPPPVTAATGVDALAHCVEAFTSKRAHPIIDGYAAQGIELVGTYLKRAVHEGTTPRRARGLRWRHIRVGFVSGR